MGARENGAIRCHPPGVLRPYTQDDDDDGRKETDDRISPGTIPMLGIFP